LKSESTPSALTLLFSGSPGRDRQGIILRSVKRLRSEGLNVVIEYVGSTVDQVRQSLGAEATVLDDLGHAAVCHGNVTYERLPAILGRASYAVLLRDDARWSRACFPSKVPEFLSLGIPLICNLTSDLGEYVRDGREALLTHSVTEEAFTEVLRRAASGGRELRERMSKCARERAGQCFDMRKYAIPLRKFIESLCVEARGVAA
jgi:glycosyltransferase involved in cell wall biosynthesis